MSKRAEMRRQKKAKTPTYNFSKDQLHKMAQNTIEEEVKKAQAETIDYMINIIALALYDEFGFGSKRIQRAIDKMVGINNEFISKRLEYDDIKQWCKDKGIEIKETML